MQCQQLDLERGQPIKILDNKKEKADNDNGFAKISQNIVDRFKASDREIILPHTFKE